LGNPILKECETIIIISAVEASQFPNRCCVSGGTLNITRVDNITGVTLEGPFNVTPAGGIPLICNPTQTDPLNGEVSVQQKAGNNLT
jgi:hypothetical protein